MNKIITNALRITLNIGPKSNYKAGLKLGIDLIKRVANFWSSHKSQKIADYGIIRLEGFRKWAAQPSQFF